MHALSAAPPSSNVIYMYLSTLFEARCSSSSSSSDSASVHVFLKHVSERLQGVVPDGTHIVQHTCARLAAWLCAGAGTEEHATQFGVRTC
jgi:hypothetical protein